MLRTTSRTAVLHHAAVASLALGLMALSGCRAAARARESGELSAAQQQLDSGNPAAALAQARATAARATGPGRHEAELLAGRAARQLNQSSEASAARPVSEAHLRQAAASPDPALSGAAHAELGLLYEGQGQYPLAAQSFRAASSLLTGTDRQQAMTHAGLCEQKAERRAPLASVVQPARSATAVSPAPSPASSAARAPVGGYALQFGAFAERRNAEQLASSIRDDLDRKRLGPPRVVQERDASGRSLHAVQAGHFLKQEDARAMQSRFGVKTVVVPAR